MRLLDLPALPQHLVIIGGSYISLEFAQASRRFGSEVTILERGSQLMFREDSDIAEIAKDILSNEYSQTQPFTDGYMAIGQAWGDYDNDGWLDLYMTGNLDANTLLHNNGDGTFSPSDFAESVRLPEMMTGGAIWADDGWRDLFVLAYGPNQLFHNEQGNGFRSVTIESRVGHTGKGISAAWADYDNGGWLDLYVTLVLLS